MQDDSNATNQTDTPAPIGGLGTPPPVASEPIISPSVGDQGSDNDLPSADPQPSASDDGGDLQDIKVKALQQLTPMVSHLNQNAEDRFKTLLMLIQASDNQDLIKDAYAAAEEISDEKAKAQALLDIVNEINYFSQRDQS